MPTTDTPRATLADPRLAELLVLLDNGQLRLVTDCAREVLGHDVAARTALRWGNGGRDGLPLPTRRGRRRARCTTVACLRRWLALTSADCLPLGATTAPVAAAAAARRSAAVDDAVLGAFGLGRRSQGARGGCE